MINVGSQEKFNISLELPCGLHMEDIEFTANFFVYPSRTVTKKKSEMTFVDADNYCVVVDTGQLGAGSIKLRVEAEVDGRKMVETIETGVVVG